MDYRDLLGKNVLISEKGNEKWITLRELNISSVLVVGVVKEGVRQRLYTPEFNILCWSEKMSKLQRGNALYQCENYVIFHTIPSQKGYWYLRDEDFIVDEPLDIKDFL